MKLMVIAFAILTLNIAGCKKDVSPVDTAETAAPASALSGMTLPVGSPSDVVVEVNGQKLTRGEVDSEAEYRISIMASQIPPEQMEMARQRIKQNSVDQFIMRILLKEEVDKRNITVSKEEEEAAAVELSKRLPPGTTLDNLLKNDPRGEKVAREDFVASVAMRKIFEEYQTNTVEVSAQEIAAFKEQYKDNLLAPETVRARHVLIGTQPTDDAATKEAKKAKAGEVRQKLVDGGDFAAIAKEYSDCPSKENGGDLGPAFPAGRMVPEFSDAAFAQEVNAIGPIVETKFGYHIIQVMEHNQASQAPDDKIMEAVRSQKRETSIQAFLDGLRSKASIKFFEENPAASQPTVTTMPFPAAGKAEASK